MENKPLYLSIYNRISSMIIASVLFVTFCIFAVFLTPGVIKQNIFASVIVLFTVIPIICLPTCILCVSIGLTNYTFGKQTIVIKRPPLQTKECYINNIIGYVQVRTRYTHFIIYTRYNSYKILVGSTNIGNAINNFMKYNYDKIIAKNREELMDKGIFIKINKKRQIHFLKDHLVFNNKKGKKTFLYKELIMKNNPLDSVAIHNAFLRLHFITNDKEKICFNLHQCRGQFGLFEYLNNYCLAK